ncbi:MAG TPA: hypothetical protein PKY77_14865 [Phycisphaerae bacterium]|nr:hypothetical protein [Phycisphaerae bacterium]HRY70572.1 hypothetical protein [Phycisphaerae bacterium]HSA28378.1 hypothetical protein [Phycisphaerae bacterium]
MGDRPVVVAEPPPLPGPAASHAVQAEPAPAGGVADRPLRDVIQCDQAVFTSVHSQMGEGYRLIAISPGLRPDEKVEITQRSPSHDSLCDSGPHAVGMLAYAMASGRYCVAYCSHAGREHTARGGQRVYTHMVLLTPADFTAFQNNPVRIHALLADLVSRQGPMLKVVPRVERLGLPVMKPSWGKGCGGFRPPASQAEAEWIWSMADALQSGRRLVLAGVREPLRLLEWAVLCLKLRVRRGMDVSAGLKYAPGRRMQLVLLPKEDAQTQRLIAGQDVELRRVGQPAPPPLPGFLPWANLLRAWYAQREVIGPR